MSSNFEQWEKDPFFPAAEEVQESADRMESAYRRWIRGRKDDYEFRELHTALSIAKWQLEEFERAVRSCVTEDARTRHRQFVISIDNQVSTIEDSIRNLVLEDGKAEMPWVQLDKQENDEPALFLTGLPPDGDMTVEGKDEERNSLQMIGDTMTDFSKNSCHSIELDMKEPREEEKVHGHRRMASASADIGILKIVVSDGDIQRLLFVARPDLPPPKILSFSDLTSTLDSTPS
ncbi:uncharacterized protein LOC143854344 [Tasmannia lanceolata]|uniref:uncharacterized protein LOC143854344 n=1 Tax=Tasmannia lanceolata TaxID=3420 RepID=UPI0040639299